MTYCAKFKTEFSEIKSEVEHLRELLLEFKSLGEKEREKEIREKLSSLEPQLEEFKKDYEEKVREMLRRWHSFEDRDHFLRSLSFNKEGRVVVEKGINLKETSVSYFPLLIQKVKRYVDVIETKIEKMNGLEEVGGSLWREGASELKSLKNLRRVGEQARFGGTKIEALDSLEEVEGDLICFEATSLKSLESLKRVEGMLDLAKTGIGTKRDDFLFSRKKRRWALESLEEVGGLWIRRTSIKNFREIFPKLKNVRCYWASSIWIDETQEHSREQIKELTDKGEIKLEGEIVPLKKL